VQIGDSDDNQSQVMREVGEFLTLFCGMQSEWLPQLPETVIPATARREHRRTENLRFDSIHVVQKLLPSRS